MVWTRELCVVVLLTVGCYAVPFPLPVLGRDVLWAAQLAGQPISMGQPQQDVRKMEIYGQDPSPASVADEKNGEPWVALDQSGSPLRERQTTVEDQPTTEPPPVGPSCPDKSQGEYDQVEEKRPRTDQGRAPSSGTADKSAPCGPDQREGHEISIITQPNGTSSVSVVYELYLQESMDYRNKKFSFNFTQFTEDMAFTWGIYLNFKEKWGYVVWWDQEICFPIDHVEELKFICERECLPPNSTYLFSSKLGAEPKWLPVDYWHYAGQMGNLSFSTIGSIQSDVHVPVVEYQVASPPSNPKAVTYTRSTTYLEVTKGIKNPNVFNPPKICYHRGLNFLHGLNKNLPDKDQLIELAKKALM